MTAFTIITFTSKTAIALWTTEDVDAPKFFEVYDPHAIAVDGNNNPHIVYGYDHLYYAYFDGSNWQYETADSFPLVGSFASLAVDLNGKAHIGYEDWYNGLKYATNASGSWVTEIVDSSGDLDDISIALDGNGKAYFS